MISSSLNILLLCKFDEAFLVFPCEWPLHILTLKYYWKLCKFLFSLSKTNNNSNLKKQPNNNSPQVANANTTFLFFLRILFSFFFSRYFCHGVRLSFPSNLFLTISSAVSLRPRTKNSKLNEMNLNFFFKSTVFSFVKE